MEILILLFLILFTFHLVYAICVYVLLLSLLDCTHFEVSAYVFDISVWYFAHGKCLIQKMFKLIFLKIRSALVKKVSAYNSVTR